MHEVGHAFAGVEFDAPLIRRLDRSGPRYTSYPTADRFHAGFGAEHYALAVEQRKLLGNRRPLSLYVHVPFCESVCYYCACNKIVTRHREQADEYLGYLLRELDMQRQMFGGQQRIEQLHFGGGTPTYLSHDQLEQLMGAIDAAFPLADDQIGEFSIEVDPRTVTPERIAHLRQIGFNRISLGVQDFDPVVQKAVHREQSFEQTQELVQAAREQNFRSVSVDLIYGLPHQNVMSFNRTLQQVLDISPDRIAIYNYAHLPHVFKPQRRINQDDLPSPEQKLDLLHVCILRLAEAGYVYIGMDHFAKPTDGLAIAQRHGRLHRNFQGYSTHADADLIALGVSAIGAVGPTYHQNAKTLPEYYGALDAGRLPIVRGIALTHDDLLRRTVIHTLLCHAELNKRSIETAYPIHFDETFAPELRELEGMASDGLVTIDSEWITVTPKGRLLVRNIAMVFDKFLRATVAEPVKRYSRTI
ncbi:oxygen-independent coproporphyrinogen III oxidase [Derxia lacustris]|uniref:oxygen-independent coproporphyrinogen III oxidase n=1 Tax=Derxia lacustris TaxID=764842 RepID=UPI001F41DAC6|nr:oxygen-independent coproporphyrinogen III oxidase [Derxia lacustris]